MRTTLLGTLFVLLLSACSDIPDVPSCRPLDSKKQTFDIPDIGKISVDRANPVCLKEIKEIRCGFCVWSVSDKTQYVGEDKKTWLYGKPWSVIELEAIKTPPESYARIKAYVMDECKRTNQCDDVARWRIKLDSLTPGSGD